MSETDGTMATEDGLNNDLAYPKDDFENELAYLNHMTSNGNESVDNDTFIFGGKNLNLRICYSKTCHVCLPQFFIQIIIHTRHFGTQICDKRIKRYCNIN